MFLNVTVFQTSYYSFLVALSTICVTFRRAEESLNSRTDRPRPSVRLSVCQGCRNLILPSSSMYITHYQIISRHSSLGLIHQLQT